MQNENGWVERTALLIGRIVRVRRLAINVWEGEGGGPAEC